MYKVLDLFAGAGGLSTGFSQTRKFQIVVAYEYNKKIQGTYKRNHPDAELFEDVRNADFERLSIDYDGIDVVIGGPPCQGFSNANRQRNHLINSNNQLVKEYVRAVNTIRPRFFVLENVSMLSSEKHKFYYSWKDKDYIDAIGIKVFDEKLAIELPQRIRHDVVNDLINGKDFSGLIVEDNVYKPINTACKKFYSGKMTKEVFDKSSFKLDKAIGSALLHLRGMPKDYYSRKMIRALKEVEGNFEDGNKKFYRSLEIFSVMQRFFRKAKELKEYELVVDGYERDRDNLFVKVKSYTVKDYIRTTLKNDYWFKDGILNAANFGAPQLRERFVMIGMRKDVGSSDMLGMPKGFLGKEQYFNVNDAISDLADHEPGKDITKDSPIAVSKFNNDSPLKKYLCDSEEIFNHVNTSTRKVALERFKALKQGENFHDLDDKFKTTYSVPKRTQNSIYLRLDYEKPSGTVLNVRKSMWVHPVKDRALSIREAARLQTFPDSYVFEGTKDSQYQQVGNAVPPLMARAIAEKILECMGCEPEEYLENALKMKGNEVNGENNKNRKINAEKP